MMKKRKLGADEEVLGSKMLPGSLQSYYGEPQRAYHCTLTREIKKMMYVSGETGEPSIETTSIIEEIVRQQVVEIVGSANSVPRRWHPVANVNNRSSATAPNLRRDAARGRSPSMT